MFLYLSQPSLQLWKAECSSGISYATLVSLITFPVLIRESALCLFKISFKITKMTKSTTNSIQGTSQISPHCPDTYIHAVWLCTLVSRFWIYVTKSLTTIFGCHIPETPSLCILGDISVINLSTTRNKILLVALTITKKTILKDWKPRNIIHIIHWKNLLTDYISLENPSTPNLNNTQNTRSPWPSFIRSCHNFIQSSWCDVFLVTFCQGYKQVEVNEG